MYLFFWLWFGIFLGTAASGCATSLTVPNQMTPTPECGRSTKTTPPSDLVRWPYLQSVTSQSATIAWATRSTDTPSVQLRIPGAAPRTISAATETLPIGRPAYQMHTATARGLQQSTLYCYEIYSGDRVLAQSLGFRTAPATAPTDEFTFYVIGDYGTGSDAQGQIRDLMAQGEPSFWLTTGDNAYPDGTYKELENYVFHIYRDIWSRIPVYPALGNHDYHTQNATPFLRDFVLPQNAIRPQDKERYYSFDWGAAHFVAIDTGRTLDEISESSPDDMADWLEADLARSQAPWKIVYMHKPAFSSGKQETEGRIRQKLVPIFERHHVSLVLSGHRHTYERSVPILAGKQTTIPAGGIVYVTTGGGGQALKGAKPDPLVPYYSVRHNFVMVSISPCGMRLRAIDNTGAEIDRFAWNQCP